MIERFITDRVKGITTYVAGRTKEEVAKSHGLDSDEVIKLASNENPYGPSPRAVEEIRRWASEVHRYPEDNPTTLLKTISEYLELPQDKIIVGGNGADEIMDIFIKLVVSKDDEVILHQPTFPYYELLVDIYGGAPVKIQMMQDFSFPIKDIVSQVTEKTKLVIICSPNNPTGNAISESGLRKILDTGVLVMLDEAYVEFAERSYTGLVNEYENLVVLRTFSKAFGLAGLRVGYGVASESFIREAMKLKPPHNVNLLAQKAAVASLEDLEHMKKTVAKIKEQRNVMFRELSQLPRLKVTSSQANFLLISLGETDAGEVVTTMEKSGIIVRSCDGFGLKNSIRITIGTEEQNQAFLTTFCQMLE